MELRGPQRFVIEFSEWLSRKCIDGFVICGSLQTLVRSIGLNRISTMMSEDEESSMIKHLPRIIRSLSFSFLSFLKIIHLNKNYRLSAIHAQDANYSAMAAIAVAKLIHVPVILHVHGINMGIIGLSIRPKCLARIYRAYYLLLQKESVKRSDCVICVSKDNERFLPRGNKIVIPMGVNSTWFQVTQHSGNLRRELRIPEQAFTLGYVGTLSAGKGLNTLLESFYFVLQEISHETSMFLLIVGDGPERHGLEDLASELGVREYVRFAGFRTDISKLLDTMDVFVFPSESEGSPIAILEAMAASKAIIASDILSIREIIDHGDEAVLVSRCNVEELKRAILLLYGNSDLRVELGRRAKERAKHYDAERVYSEILKVYKELIYESAELQPLRNQKLLENSPPNQILTG